MINDLELDDYKGYPIQDDEHKKIVSLITESMSKMSLKLKNKSSQCIFSSDMVNRSMPLYMRIKGAYADLRAYNLVPLPSQEVSMKHLSVLNPIEGVDPISMLFMKDICQIRGCVV